MKRLDEVDLDSLRWEQTGRLESKLLATGDQVVAVLKWNNGRGSLATGESAQGRWTFKRAGFLRPRVTIRRAESSDDLAVASMTWLGGSVIDFPSANGVDTSFQLKRTGILKQEWIITDAKRHRVLALTPNSGSRKQGSAVQIEKTEETSPDQLSLLTILAWYVLLLISQQDYDGAFIASLVGAGAI